MTDADVAHIHLVSDSTGETVNAVFRAAMARFPDQKPQVHLTVFIRNEAGEVISPGTAIVRFRAH